MSESYVYKNIIVFVEEIGNLFWRGSGRPVEGRKLREILTNSERY
jgi:hypothetical protein